MAAVVYGGSPRHSGSNNSNRLSNTTNPHNLSSHHSPYHPHHSQQQQQQQQHSHSNMGQPMPQTYISAQSNSGGLSLSHHYHHNTLRSSKRKSAVEMLAESKPFYVKSETVLDRQQQLNIRGNGNTSSCEYTIHNTICYY